MKNLRLIKLSSTSPHKKPQEDHALILINKNQIKKLFLELLQIILKYIIKTCSKFKFCSLFVN